MAKKIVSQGYRCNICNQIYSGKGSKKKAIDCEKQGIFGPQLRQGFTFKDLDDFPCIILEKKIPEGHFRAYIALKICIDNYEDNFDNTNNFSPKIYTLQNFSKAIKRIALLPSKSFNKNESSKLSKLINQAESMKEVRDLFKENEIKKLYFSTRFLEI